MTALRTCASQAVKEVLGRQQCRPEVLAHGLGLQQGSLGCVVFKGLRRKWVQQKTNKACQLNTRTAFMKAQNFNHACLLKHSPALHCTHRHSLLQTTLQSNRHGRCKSLNAEGNMVYGQQNSLPSEQRSSTQFGRWSLLTGA